MLGSLTQDVVSHGVRQAVRGQGVARHDFLQGFWVLLEIGHLFSLSSGGLFSVPTSFSYS